MIGLLTGLFSMIGGGIQSFFGLKERQAEVIGKSIEVMGDINASSAQREQAIANVVMAEANSGSWLTRIWRPLVMCVFSGILISYFFGLVAPNVLQPIPAGSPLDQLFEIVKVGLMGYIPARSFDKAIESFTRSKNLQKLLESFIKSR